MTVVTQLLFPTWRKLRLTLLLVVMALLLSVINSLTGKLLKDRAVDIIMGSDYRQRAAAIAASYSCERDAELAKLIPQSQESGDYSATAWTYWGIGGTSMLLVCYLFACIILYPRAARGS